MALVRAASMGRSLPLAHLARVLSAAAAVGLILGALVGGVVSRLAMRLLFLTSNPSVKGLESDDGFLIGQFTTDTLNLVFTGALFGVVGSFTYLAVRPFLLGPSWLRSLTCAAASGAVIGSLIINPDGVDFTRLSPVSLAVVLFIAIPALFGALCPPVVDWALRPEGWARTAPLKFVAAPLGVFLFPPLFVVLAIPTAIVLASWWYLRQTAAAHHVVTLWAFRVGWAGVATFGILLLAEDILALRDR